MWYTIESTEDWLSRLAGKYLNDVNRWPEIYSINEDIIGSDPNKIQIGMTIWIPVDGKARPSGQAPQGGVYTGSTGDSNMMLYVGAGAVLLGLTVFFLKKK